MLRPCENVAAYYLLVKQLRFASSETCIAQDIQTNTNATNRQTTRQKNSLGSNGSNESDRCMCICGEPSHSGHNVFIVFLLFSSHAAAIHIRVLVRSLCIQYSYIYLYINKYVIVHWDFASYLEMHPKWKRISEIIQQQCEIVCCLVDSTNVWLI